MTNDRKDEAPAASAEEWPKRAPPTIDLDASEVSGDTRAERLSAVRAFMRTAAGRASRLRSGVSMLLAPLSGAIAALLVLAAFWAGGLIGQPQLAPPAPPAVSSAQFDNVAANVGDLTARLARVEASATRPAAPATDPALAGRTEALERALATVREEAQRLSAQLRTVTASLNELKAAPRDGAAAPAPDLAPLDERLTRLEAAVNSLSAELAKPAAPSADDQAVRRLVAANTLEIAVRRGEPYAPALAAAKQVAASPAALAPLDRFASGGIPSETALLREIVAVLERAATDAANAAKRSEAPTAQAPQGGVLDRLQSGLCKSSVSMRRNPGQPCRRLPPMQPFAATASRRRGRTSPGCRLRQIRKSRPGSRPSMRASRH
jgi:hypothetical protein